MKYNYKVSDVDLKDMDNDNDITKDNAGEQTDTCGLISSPALCYTADFFHLSLQDCMEGMRAYPDKYFDLAIVDPPYGINAGKGTEIYLSNNGKQDWKGKTQNDHTIYGDWDSNKPDDRYFQELFRVSKNQIIWGGNYFPLPPSSCCIVWDKENGDSFFADGELAWASFKTKLRIFRFLSCGFMGSHKNRDTRIHPTQKPVKLYEWLLKNYAKPGDKILDTHLGSGSSVIRGYSDSGDV